MARKYSSLAFRQYLDLQQQPEMVPSIAIKADAVEINFQSGDNLLSLTMSPEQMTTLVVMLTDLLATTPSIVREAPLVEDAPALREPTPIRAVEELSISIFDTV